MEGAPSRVYKGGTHVVGGFEWMCRTTRAAARGQGSFTEKKGGTFPIRTPRLIGVVRIPQGRGGGGDTPRTPADSGLAKVASTKTPGTTDAGYRKKCWGEGGCAVLRRTECFSQTGLPQ